jgi:dTMP kinase
VRTLDFPQYEDNFFGGFVGECLRGEHGDFLGVNPQIASVLYAADRFESAVKLRKWLDEGATVVLDRYVSANQIHQGGKIADTRARAKFLMWLDKMEYDVFDIPRPDKVIYLDVPIAISQELLRKSGKKLDNAEQNLQYLENSRKSALWLARREDNWERIICTNRGKLRSIEDIHKEILGTVR